MTKTLLLALFLIGCADEGDSPAGGGPDLATACEPPDGSFDSHGCPTARPNEGDACCPIDLRCSYTCVTAGEESEWVCKPDGKWKRGLTAAVWCSKDLGPR